MHFSTVTQIPCGARRGTALLRPGFSTYHTLLSMIQGAGLQTRPYTNTSIRRGSAGAQGHTLLRGLTPARRRSPGDAA